MRRVTVKKGAWRERQGEGYSNILDAKLQSSEDTLPVALVEPRLLT